MITIFNILGPGVAITVFAAILAFHTAVLGYLAWPIQMLLEVISLPEAAKVATGFLIGFFDQFTPAVIATNVEILRSPIQIISAKLPAPHLLFPHWGD